MYGKSENAADYQRVPRPVAAMAVDFPDGHRVGRHAHRRSQLLFAATGVLVVRTDAGTWVTPPLRGVWVPAGMLHTLQVVGPSQVRTLWVEPAAAAHLPSDRCAVIAVPPLLRELIVEATRLPVRYDESGRDGLVMSLLLADLRLVPLGAFHLPVPQELRVATVCRAILARPARDEPLVGFARQAHVSERTLARAFLRTTGMTFGQWRQQARILASLPKLAAGEPVLNVALDLGYDSPSAFAAAFRRSLGVPPSRYFAHPG